MDVSRLLDGRLKFRHLILADALTEQGSVVGAAAYLHVTQPVVTRGLHDLEDILGVTLYERGPRGIKPTVFGSAFTQHARTVLAQLADAGRQLAELATADQGTVLVGTHLAGSNLLLPRAIARLKTAHPKVVVVVHEATPEALLNDLDAGRIDCIVGRLTAFLDRPGTIQKALYDETVHLVTGIRHRTAGEAEVRLADLIDYPWIIPGVETGLRAELVKLLARHELPLPANRIECTSILTIRQLLAETDSIGILPRLIALDDPRIAILPVPLDPISHTVGVTVPAGRLASSTTTALLHELQAVAAEIQ